MEDDANMDAPQISTLRDEGTPPASSPAGSAGRLRVKLVVSNKGQSPAVSVPAKRARSDDEGEDEEDDQEDQLIDDDDEVAASVSAPVEAAPAPAATPKRKAPAKRKAKKIDVKDEPAGFDPNHISLTVAPSESVSAPPAKRKKVERAAKPPAAPRTVKPRVTKTKTVVSQLAAEDSGAVSEGFSGTAASSPVTMPSPEPEPLLPPSVSPFDEEKEINLENVPIPVYALPTKPFPVQPAPKVPTGYAPTIPLDRSDKKVRHWRVANREIRGIAGGRWFTRSWVGDKQSEYAGSKIAFAEAALAIPRLPALLGGKPKVKTSKSLPLTAGSSRSESVAGDGPPPVRNLTKMRTSMLGPSSEAGDSDMMG
ncbi:hypothetical protein CPB85DRAFT_1295402 [Mucidula mucida]|nr:hypothetical protein CPB85DRAFT_1295402 [Mucidula mucida]